MTDEERVDYLIRSDWIINLDTRTILHGDVSEEILESKETKTGRMWTIPISKGGLTVMSALAGWLERERWVTKFRTDRDIRFTRKDFKDLCTDYNIFHSIKGRAVELSLTMQELGTGSKRENRFNTKFTYKAIGGRKSGLTRLWESRSGGLDQLRDMERLNYARIAIRDHLATETSELQRLSDMNETTADVECYLYSEIGHIAERCPNRRTNTGAAEGPITGAARGPVVNGIHDHQTGLDDVSAAFIHAGAWMLADLVLHTTRKQVSI
jgi:hypothetical protein